MNLGRVDLTRGSAAARLSRRSASHLLTGDVPGSRLGAAAALLGAGAALVVAAVAIVALQHRAALRARQPGQVASLGPSTRRPPFGVGCTSRQLLVQEGPRVSEMTEQSSRIFVLRNVSSGGCDLRGYPSISLTDGHGKVIPFRYRHGGDQEITGRQPATVPVPSGRSAYVAINTSICQGHALDTASYIWLRLPGTGSGATLHLAPYPLLPYCGPGRTPAIDVTPVEPTAGALWSSGT
jgi:hypothetical protein